MWSSIIMFVVSTLVSMAMSHHQQKKINEDAAVKPGDIVVPTVTSADYLPVLFGSRKLTEQNVLWYGAQNSTPVRKNTGVWIKSNFAADWQQETVDWANEKVQNILDHLPWPF